MGEIEIYEDKVVAALKLLEEKTCGELMENAVSQFDKIISSFSVSDGEYLYEILKELSDEKKAIIEICDFLKKLNKYIYDAASSFQNLNKYIYDAASSFQNLDLDYFKVFMKQNMGGRDK